ncbi:MAG: 23S rRNA (guanosine(2251)-2'-O)-methyltransferase RlmB [Candidatus Dojkabacteria bacterium]|nr:MAG: 23S rRNA (guanosine(2251)-2'-O)-methyltransferase RlmB [Candidatus Dojkabacteria bacterium]
MLVYGRNVVLEALRSDSTRVFEIKLQEGTQVDQKIKEIINIANLKKIPIQKIGLQSLHHLTSKANHQGIVAEVELRTYQSIKKFLNQSKSFKHNAFIYVSESQLSQNLGAIARTAEVAGFRGIIIPPKQNITSEAIKISTGALFNLPIIRDSLFNTIKTLKKNEFWIYGIERDGKIYCKTNIDKKALFIIGGEDKSLSEAIRKQCDEILEIPQFGNINSLNMSVATGIIIFEYIRQNYV